MRWGKLEKLMAALWGCWPDGGRMGAGLFGCPVAFARLMLPAAADRYSLLTGRDVRIGCGVAAWPGWLAWLPGGAFDRGRAGP